MSFVVGSIRDTVPSPPCATHTPPCLNAMPIGPRPPQRDRVAHDIVTTGVTVTSASFVTQTDPPPAAIPRGRLFTLIALTTPSVRGFACETVLSPWFATQK